MFWILVDSEEGEFVRDEYVTYRNPFCKYETSPLAKITIHDTLWMVVKGVRPLH